MKTPSLILMTIILCNLSIPINAQILTSRQQKEDFDTLYSLLHQVHPDLFLYQTQKEFEKKHDSIYSSLNKERNLSDFYFIVSPFVASVKDGHTNFTIPATQDRITYLNNGGLTLPLRLKIVENKILVDFPLISCSIQENDEIICMNNINSQTILSQLYLLLGAEKGNAIKENQLTSYLSTLLWYKYNWGEKYDFTIKRGKKIWKESLDGISQIDAFPVLKARLGKSLPQFVYTLSPDKQTATLQIMNLYQLPQLKQFCDSVFSVINREHVPNLVIDVRNNKGGSSAGVDMLLSYLSHDAYTLYIKTDLKISSYSKQYNEQKHPETYEEIKNLPDGSLFAIRDSFVEGNRDKADIYKGSVTVLVNESTYSGASTFASAIKKSHAGKVLGETGCPTVYFGNYMSFTLPNSRLEYYISLNKFYE